MIATQDCDVAVNSDTPLKQIYLLLATKPNYTRGRVGCPSDTRPLKTKSNANLRKVRYKKKILITYLILFFSYRDKINYSF